MVQDSQYPFREGESVRITLDPYHKMMIVRSVQEPQIEVSPNYFVIKGSKIEMLKSRSWHEDLY